VALLKPIFYLAGKGSAYREGASPPLEFFPPLELCKIREIIIILFERGIKGVSKENQPNTNRNG
jgi:hypothetical protein